MTSISLVPRLDQYKLTWTVETLKTMLTLPHPLVTVHMVAIGLETVTASPYDIIQPLHAWKGSLSSYVLHAC